MSWYDPSWNYRKQITIDHTKVDADFTDFPILAYLSSDSDISANAQTNGNDILFTSDDGTTKLSHEIEKYDSSTGELWAHVKIPSLSSTSDTIIYIYYGNASATNQQDASGVWTNGFVGVWHLGSNGVQDSQGSYTTTNNGADAYSSGQVDGAYDFIHANSDNMSINSSVRNTYPMTIEAITYSDDVASGNYIIANGGETSGSYGFFILWNDSNKYFQMRFSDAVSGYAAQHNYSTAVASGAWHHLAGFWDGNTADNAQYYADGSLDGTEAPASATTDTARDMYIGRSTGSTTYSYDGRIEEIRISSVVRSATWISTTYTFLFTPTSCITVGSQETSEASASGDISLDTDSGYGNELYIDVVNYGNEIRIRTIDMI